MRRLVTGGHAGPAGSQQPEPGWSHRCTGWWCPCRRWSGAKRLPLWVCEAMPLGGSCLRSRLKRSPLRWLRAFIVAEARGAAFGEDLFRHGFAVSPSPSGEGLGMPFALLLLGLCSKLTTLPFGEGTRVRQNRPRRLARLYRGRGAGRSVWGGPHPSRLRRATFPIGGRLRK